MKKFSRKKGLGRKGFIVEGQVHVRNFRPHPADEGSLNRKEAARRGREPLGTQRPGCQDQEWWEWWGERGLSLETDSDLG